MNVQVQEQRAPLAIRSPSPFSGRSRRMLVSHIMTAVCGLMVLVAIIPLFSVFWLVLSRGFKGLSLSFFTALPLPVGEIGGGIGNAIVGTLYMVGMASLIGLPVGIAGGIFLAERGDGKLGRLVRFTTEVLASVPSIVIGIVAYGLVVKPMHGQSALAGAIALSIIIVPPLARGTEEILRTVPSTLREASLALGVPAWKTSIFVMVRTALSGIRNVSLLAIARAAGETAPLLFTALNNQYWNLHPTRPTSSLTVQLYTYAISSYEDWHDKAWSAALCLLIFVGLLNLFARLKRAK